MAKMGINFGEGGFKGFATRHVEKMVLVVVILLMGWFVYSGSGVTSIDSNLRPEILKTEAKRANEQVTKESWHVVSSTREPRQVIIDEKRALVEGSDYAHKYVSDPPLVPTLSLRSDPKILAPENLVVTTLEGPLALMFEPKGKDDDELPPDPLQGFESVLGQAAGGMGRVGGLGGGMPMAPARVDVDDKKKSKATRQPKTAPSGGTSAGGPGAEPGDKKRRKKDDDDPYGTTRTPAMATGPGAGTSQSTARSSSPEATLGIKASGTDTYVVPAIANVINATVPNAKQWAEYQTAFAQAHGGQDADRDVPQYLGVWVERAVVTANPDAADGELKWERLPFKVLKEMDAKYGVDTSTLETSDPEALDPKLTFRVPPFMLTNLLPALSHPDIPEASSIVDEEFEDGAVPAATNDDEFEFGGDEAEAGGPGGGRMPGAGRRPGAGPGGGMPRLPRGPGGGGRIPGARGPGGGRGPGMGAGPGAGFGGGKIDLATVKVVPRKQIRYIDFNVKHGEKYRYRMQVVLVDPNHPTDSQSAPEITTLDDKSRERVRKLDAEDAKASERTGRTVRTFHIVSAHSKPSAVVTAPSTDRFYAGESMPYGSLPIGTSIRVNMGEPSIKVLGVKWDEELVANVPAEMTLQRGAAMVKTVDAEVVHPLLGDVRKVPKREVNMEGVLLDIYGGELLPGSDSKDPVRVPGEALVVDRDGNLRVTDEARDAAGYHRFYFPEPKASKTTAAGAEGVAPGMEGMMKGPPGPGPAGPSGPGPKGPKGKGSGKT